MTQSTTTIHDGRSYYGRPVLKEPVWTWEIPWYFFAGGTAGAANGLGYVAGLLGNHELGKRMRWIGMAGLAVSPALLISDLGRPERFLNMLRVFKVTSPMSVGTWILTAGGAATGTALALDRLRLLPRVERASELAAAVLGLPVATYTAALVSDTAIPVWHEARQELPFVFAAGSAASAGAAGAMLTPPRHAGPARRLAVLGGLAELAGTEVMEKRLGDFVGEPYHQGRAGAYARAAKACTALGTLGMALHGRSRRGALLAGGLLLAGSALERWSVFEAGFQSARDPKYTVEPQRERLSATRPSEPADVALRRPGALPRPRRP